MKIYNIQSKILTSAFFLSMACLGGIQSASADWVLDRYEYKGESVSKRAVIYEEFLTDAWKSKVETEKIIASWTEGQGQKNQLWFNGKLQPESPDAGYSVMHSSVAWGNGSHFLPGNSPTIAGIGPHIGRAKVSVRPVFRWERNKIYQYDPQTGKETSYPDPNDNPPEYCWILEQATVSGEQSTRQWDGNSLYYFVGGLDGSAPHYYKDIEYTFSDIQHPFGLQYNGVTQDSYYTRTATFSLEDSQVIGFKRLPNQDIAIGPERSFAGRITLNPFLVVLDRYAEGSIQFKYNAYPTTLRVLSRRKTDHDPNDLVTDFNFYPLLRYSQSSVVAGTKVTDNHEHEADVVLEVPGVGNAKMKWLPALELDEQSAKGANGSVSARLVPTDGTYSGVLVNGRAPITKLLSRDLTSHESNLGVWIVPKKSGGTSSLVSHEWGEVEWKMGANGEKEWVTGFPNFISGGYKEWIWARIKNADKSVLDHTMKFVAERIVVTERNTQNFFDPAMGQIPRANA